jgi:O-antigen ligase
MKLEIKVSTLVTIFTFIGLLFVSGILNFLFRTLTGDSSGGGGLDSVLVDTAGNPVNKLIGSGILITCLFYSIKYKLLLNKEFIIKNLWVFVFVLYILFSCFWSVEPSVTFKRSIFLLSLVFFAGYLSRFYTIKTMFTCLGYIIALTAVIGLIRAALFPSEAFLAGGIREGAFIGMFVEKNGGARRYMFGILLLLPAIYSHNRKALFAAGICLLCLLMARSASAILLLTISAGTFFYLNKFVLSSQFKINKARYWFGILIYFVGLFIAYQAYEFILSLVGRDATLTNRTIIWELLWPLIQEKIILGYGYGAFWSSYGAEEFIANWGYVGNAHNGYLEMLLHGGIPLLVIFVFMVLKGVVGSVNNASCVDYAKEYNVCIAMIIMLLISNFIAYSLPNHNSFDFFVFMLILFYANKRPEVSQYDTK